MLFDTNKAYPKPPPPRGCNRQSKPTTKVESPKSKVQSPKSKALLVQSPENRAGCNKVGKMERRRSGCNKVLLKHSSSRLQAASLVEFDRRLLLFEEEEEEEEEE